jgi:O-antigen biosynthesis protein
MRIKGLLAASNRSGLAPRKVLSSLYRKSRRWTARWLDVRQPKKRRAQVRQVAESPWFDAQWYLSIYPDVAASGVDPARHYLLHGAAEGRDPGPGFSTAGYLARYSDVALSGINPLLHYLNVGVAQGRRIAARDSQRGALRAICVCGEPNSVGHGYRVQNLVTALAGAGCESSWMTIDAAVGRVQEIGTAKLLVLWRTAWDDSLALILRAARSNGAIILFDADDLIIEPKLARVDVIDGIRTQGLSEREVASYYRRTLTSFEASDWASCTTQELGAAMRRRGKPTFDVPNGFDEGAHRRARLAVRRRRAAMSDGVLRIGYATGTRTHQRDFAAVAEPISCILRERPDRRLVLFRQPGNGPPLLDPAEFSALRGLEGQIEWRELVSPDDLPDEIARFDINIAPLEVGNAFCEAKSEVKFLEAALVEVCTVASPTGPFRRAIRPGETGFLADDAASWAAILRRLLEDATLRRRIGRAAYRDVLWTYGPHRRTELVASMLEQLWGDARAAARAFAMDVGSRSDRRAVALPAPEPEVVVEADRLGSAEVTVVVPVYNYRGYVIEALDSVASQTRADIDLVVVDDASTDGSLAVVETWMRVNAGRFNRAVLLRNRSNAGLGPTRNVAFDMAETPFVLPLDADNRLFPDACDALLTALRDDGAAFVYPLIKQFDGGETIMGKAPYAAQRLVGGNYIDAMAMIRKDCWAAVGGYYGDFPQGWEDFEFWCRIAQRGLWGRQVPKILAEYRVHNQCMQKSTAKVPHYNDELIAFMRKRYPWLSLAHTFPPMSRFT